MSSEESLNTLIGNFVSLNTDNTIITQNNMICFDTSQGFLGFNTIDPSYEIHVLDGTIKTDNLILNNIIRDDNIEFNNLPIGSVYEDSTSGYLKIKNTS